MTVSQDSPEASLVRAYLESAYPSLLAGLLTGSVVRGTATATSDIDVVVLLPAGAGTVRTTVGWSGRTVDVFGYDPDGLSHWLLTDAARRRPSLCSLVLDGVLVAGSPTVAAAAQAEARRVFEAGPEPYSPEELLRMRYGVTDALLDLETAGDRSESLLLASVLVTDVVNLLFATLGRWSGNGKWLLRELRAYDGSLASALETAYDAHARSGDAASLIAVADQILARCGGRFLIGRSERG